ncbi:MAG: HlyD family efflux transporter periplasmic adaptor subunit, partial [Planctomycetota bacterium]|nr:HlyD family efflux transporter periplasmic adaptor subunit [Planctomycetota bacterium]
DQLESDRRLAQSQVERCEITAPFDGVIAAVLVEVGEQVAPGAPIARVFDPSTIELPLRIPASARGRVRVGDEVVVNRTVTDEPIVAPIGRIAPEDDAGSRTMTVFVELRSDGGRVVPGLFVHGEVIESDRRLRTIVPRRSVVNQRVMLIEDDRIRFQPVRASFPLNVGRPETGLADRQWLVLESLLPENAKVVIDGSRDLEAGVAVEARPPTGSAEIPASDEAGTR